MQTRLLRLVEERTSQLFSQHLEDYADSLGRDNAAMIRGLDKKEGMVQEEVTHNPHVPELLSIQVPAVLNNSLDPRLSSILRVTHATLYSHQISPTIHLNFS